MRARMQRRHLPSTAACQRWASVLGVHRFAGTIAAKDQLRSLGWPAWSENGQQSASIGFKARTLAEFGTPVQLVDGYVEEGCMVSGVPRRPDFGFERCPSLIWSAIFKLRMLRPRLLATREHIGAFSSIFELSPGSISPQPCGLAWSRWRILGWLRAHASSSNLGNLNLDLAEFY
ncbi:uncharacterized protein BDZ99DRAFT_462218 [Mytilinidion resinicola]|uniref:Uncharacterized protein n=1 Tax=Mytilinidion resinicola TaxID=574789 RepID=A0A6A6YPX8_9PEZI|nr:uncharacterized protein BDZ99DRAFT_462218 [Mytilinidion resinicola]KAF2810932.1 hypothetical protein BDZ99DRAFT_462218 [Mytilinidion resinicola]